MDTEDRLRLLSDAIPAMVWTLATDASGEYFNESWLRYTGLTAADSKGFGWTTVVHSEDVTLAFDALRKAMAEQTPFLHDVRYRRRDGVCRWHVVRALPMKGSDGAVRRWVAVATDIQEQKETEEALRRMTDERKQAEERILHLLKEAEQRERDLHDKQAQLVQAAKLASIGELATGVAHELNNPLNNIGLIVGNLLDAAKSEVLDHDSLVANLQVTMGQVDRAARIVDQLRRFGRLSTSERSRLDVNDLVRSSLALIGEQLRLRGVRVTTDFSTDEATVTGNGLELEQVIINMMANARDAVADAPRKEIAIRTSVDGEVVSVEISDTGCGMTADVQGRIFDPFFTTKEVGKGTGLGLSLSYGIVKDHQGQIDVMSDPGCGSSFVIRLPRAAPARTEGEAEQGRFIGKARMGHSPPSLRRWTERM